MQSTAERGYIGASGIGEECSRKLWLTFHKYAEPQQFDSRMLRLFYRGQREEGFFEMYLRDSGFTIVENCMSQARWTDGFFSGAGDGIVEKDGIRYVCEFKTASDSAFKQLKRGELETIKPMHYAQMQINGSKFDCKYAIYLCVNKNNDELFCDVIEIDSKKVEAIHAKAEYISMADKPPPRIASKPTAYQCKYCHVKDVCHGFELPRINCRNCVNSVKHRSTGSFQCEILIEQAQGKKVIVDALPESGSCPSHTWNPYYMNEVYGWKIVEFHPKERAVQYEHVINGSAPFGVPSKEIKL
jgi:CRISPR/Cas system-associated exonuclease Cas4 (RecB family)